MDIDLYLCFWYLVHEGENLLLVFCSSLAQLCKELALQFRDGAELVV